MLISTMKNEVTSLAEAEMQMRGISQLEEGGGVLSTKILKSIFYNKIKIEILRDLSTIEPFKNIPWRSYSSFTGIQSNLLHGLDEDKFCA